MAYRIIRALTPRVWAASLCALGVIGFAARAGAAVPADYATPSDFSASSWSLPRAYPPGSIKNTFAHDVNLPEIDHYQTEVLRYVRGGYFPATVVQFAVIRPERPVQVLVIKAHSNAPWIVDSRWVGTMPWPDYLALRAKALPIMLAAPPVPERLTLGCLDDGGGNLAYRSIYSAAGILVVQRDVGCQGRSPASDLSDQMITAAFHAVGQTPPP